MSPIQLSLLSQMSVQFDCPFRKPTPDIRLRQTLISSLFTCSVTGNVGRHGIRKVFCKDCGAFIQRWMLLASIVQFCGQCAK